MVDNVDTAGGDGGFSSKPDTQKYKPVGDRSQIAKQGQNRSRSYQGNGYRGR